MQTETVPVYSGFRGCIDGMIASVVPGVVSRDANIFLVDALTNGFGNGVSSAREEKHERECNRKECSGLPLCFPHFAEAIHDAQNNGYSRQKNDAMD
jgi:hypothetical protein